MLKLFLHMWKLNFYSIIEYRASFLSQIFGMILSDVITIVIWTFFFIKLGKIGGMNFDDYIILYLVILFVFSFVHIFFNGYEEISESITSGKLDIYLTFPKNPLYMILINKMYIGVYGDFLFGLGLLFFVKNLTFIFILKLFVLSILGGIVFLGFMIFFHSLTFFIGSSKELTRGVFELIYRPISNPTSFTKI